MNEAAIIARSETRQPFALLSRRRSATLCLSLAFLIAAGYAIILLGPGVVFGTSQFWEWPRGIMGADMDIRSTLSGYYWLVQDSWRWPLLAVPNANWPHGTNVGLMDVVPIVGLLGKLLHGITGILLNPYPFWVLGTFALNAVALTSLVRALGQRSLLATILSAGLGAMAPVLHFRFGHLALSAHWLPIFALALYVSSRNRDELEGSACCGFLALAVIAVGVNLYLFVMTAAIAAAAFVQAAFDRRISPLRSLGWCASLVVAGIAPLWMFGMLGVAELGSSTLEFGRDSMNVLSPFWPQTSGAFVWTGNYWLTRGSIGATPGQYEGYAYLGLGALLLIIIALWQERKRLWPLLRRNAIFAAAILVLTLWAVSNRVYVGPYLVLSFPLPEFLLHTVLAWFRSSGRFFWPVGWLIVALGIAGTLRSLRPRAAVMVAIVCLAVQWIDLSLWRTRIGVIVAPPYNSVLGAPDIVNELRGEIAAKGTVTVLPRVFCSSAGDEYDSVPNVAAIDIQLLAARGNARMTSAFVARGAAPCEEDAQATLTQLAGDGVLVVLSDPQGRDRTGEARATLSCRDIAVGVECVGHAAVHPDETPSGGTGR